MKLAAAVTAEAWVNYTGTSTTGAVNHVISRRWGTSGGWLLALTKDSTGQQRAYFSVNASGTEYKASTAVTPGKLHLAGRYRVTASLDCASAGDAAKRVAA